MMVQSSVESRKEEIYSFWRTVPLIKKVPDEKFEITKQETRGFIIELLRTGIEDEKGENNRRHALNVQEIQKSLNENGIKTSLQNTYFHLNILLTEDLIKEITILKEGRFNKRYYGRTAKLFLFGDLSENMDTKLKEGKEMFLQLLKITSPKADTKLASDVIETFLKEKLDYFKIISMRLDQWFKNNADALIELNVDVKENYELLSNILFFGNESDSFKELASLLKI